MTVEGTRSTRRGKRAVFAAFASILLASCTASDSDLPMGFAGIAPTIDMGETGGFVGAATEPVPSAAEFPPPAGEAAMAGAPVADEGAHEAMAGAPPPVPDAREATAAIEQAPEQQQVAAQDAATEPETQQAAALAEQPAGDEQAVAGEDASGSAQPAQEATQFLENIPPAQAAALAPAEPRKRGLLAFFSNGARQAPQQAARSNRQAAAVSPAPAPAPTAAITASAATAPIIQLASTGEAVRPLIDHSDNALPGVRQNALFEITRRSGLDDDADIDLHEGGLYQVASVAPGMARLAPNGLLKQREDVDVSCLKPSLVRVLKSVERHFGRKMVVTSGYRSPDHNRRVRGARNSLHMYCAAADVQVEGVSKWDLAQYVRSMPGRGGVGTYCHTESVHIDIGPERDWNWRCRRRK